MFHIGPLILEIIDLFTSETWTAPTFTGACCCHVLHNTERERAVLCKDSHGACGLSCTRLHHLNGAAELCRSCGPQPGDATPRASLMKRRRPPPRAPGNYLTCWTSNKSWGVRWKTATRSSLRSRSYRDFGTSDAFCPFEVGKERGEFH